MRKRLLWHNNETVPLMPKAFEVLLALARRHGQVVKKDDLMRSVWGDTTVEENSLNVQVSALRKAFGEKPREHRYIVTLPGVGYKFVAEVREIYSDARETASQEKTASQDETLHLEKEVETEGEAPDRASATRRAFALKILAGVLAAGALAFLAYLFWPRGTTTPARQPLKTVAVLPFKSLSDENRDESLEMGMAETLITRLSTIRQLVVRPMSAVRKYTDPSQDPLKAAQELQVDAVLDGSLQKAGDRLRVTVRLMNVHDGTTLWADQFDQDSTDIFKVQDSISERTAKALTLKLNGEEQERLTRRYTESPEAYQLYLQGRNLWKKRVADDYRKSLGYYQQAIEKDPNFALAYVGMAVSYIKLNGYHALAPDEAYSKARDALTRALALDDTLAEAHNTLAEIRYQYDYDWSGAEQEFRRAVELNPNVASIHQSYSWYLMSAGRFDEALTEIDKAQELDPRDLIISIVKGRIFYFMRQYDRSIEQLRKVLEAEPNPVAHWSLGEAYAQQGRYPEAVEEFLTDSSLQGTLKPEDVAKVREIFRVSGWQGYVQNKLDHLNEQSKRGYVSPVQMASNYAWLGKKNEALAWLEKTVDAHDAGAVSLRTEPSWDSLRSDPGFIKLLERTNQVR